MNLQNSGKYLKKISWGDINGGIFFRGYRKIAERRIANFRDTKNANGAQRSGQI